MTTLLNATDSNFDQEVLNSSMLVLVDFWAPWCGPCRKLSPILEELSAKLQDKVKIVKINVDENNKKAGEFGVSGIPAMFLFVNGDIKERLVGLHSKAQLESILRKYL